MKKENNQNYTMCRKRILSANPNRDISDALDKKFEDDEDYKRKAKDGFPNEFLKLSESREPQQTTSGNKLNVGSPKFQIT